MRPFTRISKAPRRRSLAAACWFLGAFLLGLLATPVGAVPVVAEVRVLAAASPDAARGDTGQVVEQALAEAVRVVVRRHVKAADLAGFSSVVRSSLLERASRYVVRYAIADPLGDDQAEVVRVEAEVDGPRVLARLTELGVPVAQLPVKPRVLLAALDPAAAAVLSPLGRLLEEAGYQLRLGSGGWEPVPVGMLPTDPGYAALVAGRVAEEARSAGCHLAVAVAGLPPAEREPAAGARVSPPAWSDGLWQGGERVPARVSVSLAAWLVDPGQRVPLGRLEARGEGGGVEPSAADRAAAQSAARHLAYGLLERLEQSGWALEGTPGVLHVQVSGLLDPLLVEQLGIAWNSAPEVRRVDLVEVARARATWRLQVVDAGLAWEAVLSTLRLPRGSLVWDAFPPAGGGGPAGPSVLGARWSGP